MQTNFSLEDVIRVYDLQPHIEGGYSQLLYQDAQMLSQSCLTNDYESPRCLWNGIYYLLPSGGKCIFHRIRMTELWNFYLGVSLELFEISPEGMLKKIILGPNILSGEKFAYVFPKNHWIAAKCLSKKSSEFSLVSCITTPGFTFADWEKGERKTLLKKYPSLRDVIISLT
jgi:uncharacterized protein